jgi:hypothetical protein
MGDLLRGLGVRKAGVLWGGLMPGIQSFFGRHTVDRGIDLRAAKSRGIAGRQSGGPGGLQGKTALSTPCKLNPDVPTQTRAMRGLCGPGWLKDNRAQGFSDLDCRVPAN